MNVITVEGQLRTQFGKKASYQHRSQLQVPGVIYGGQKEINFYATEKQIKPLVYTPNFQIAEVKIRDKTYRCILKDLQFHKITDKLIHIDLLELVEEKKLIANIPIHFKGTAEGVKAGGKLVVKMKSLKVKTYPKYLQECIAIDTTQLQVGQNIRVEDVKIEQYEILNSPRIPIVSVDITRMLKQEESAKATAEKK
ncbi:MAG: 50S ribosomal protein L25 [Chitinophagaceae bacterium]